MKNVNPRDKEALSTLIRITVFQIVLPYLRALGKRLEAEPDPVQALPRLLNHERLPASAVLAALGGTVGVYAGAQLAVASLGIWSGLGYSLGLVSMPFWGPVAGGLLGAAAVGGTAYMALSALRPRTAAPETPQEPPSMAVATVAVAVAPPEVWAGAAQLLDALLAVDFGASARQRRKDILARGTDVAAAAATIVAVASGQAQLLTLVAQGYALARAALADTDEGRAATRQRVRSLAAQLGLDPDALDLLLNDVDEQLRSAAQEAATHARG